jgi:hypothetical protein
VKVHWQQTSSATLEREITVIVPAEYAYSSTMYAVNNAVLQANRSPYLHLTIHVPNVAPVSCPTTHCVIVTRADLPYPNVEKTTWGWNSAGHMYGIAARVILDSVQANGLPHPTNVLVNAGCHGIAGHAMGLSHGDIEGPCQGGKLTGTDLANIAAAHRHRDAVVYGTASQGAVTLKTSETSDGS